jgi:Leucine-rich repeat (LRR) protein
VLATYGLTNLVLPPDSTNLHSLHLHGEFTDASFLNPLWSLRTLRLNYAKITTLPSGLTNLVELSLDGNPLTNVSFLNDLKNLTDLSLSSCTLSNVTDLRFLNGLSQLRKLDLSYNDFTTFQLPPESGATNLVELNLAGNPLTNVSLLNLKYLTMLSLSRCALANQGDIRFLNASTHLRNLDIADNGFTSFQIPAELASLESLSLAGNSLTDFILTNSLPRLEELNLSGNALTQVNLAPAQRSLKRLNLSYNPLTELPFLEDFSQLEVLDFYTQNLTSFTLPWGLTSLKTLGLRIGMLVPSEVPTAESTAAKLKIIVVEPNFTYVGIPASTDLSRLTLHGHWKNRVSVLGLWMQPPTRRPDGKVGLRISGAAGRTVQVQASTNLVDWDNWQSVVLGTNGAELVDEPSSGPMRYFRPVRVPADER